jgi:hypothetical protein
MQRGSLAIVSRKEGPAVWQFRWSEKDLHGSRVQRKRVLGTVERYPHETAARSAIAVLLAEVNWDVSMGSRSIAVAQRCTWRKKRGRGVCSASYRFSTSDCLTRESSRHRETLSFECFPGNR